MKCKECVWKKTKLSRVWLTCKCNLQVLGELPKECPFCRKRVVKA